MNVRSQVTNVKNKSKKPAGKGTTGSKGGGYVNKKGQSNVKGQGYEAWKKKQPKSILDK